MSEIMGESVSSKASRVNVAIRVRPLIERENTTGAQRHWLITDKDLRACDSDRKPLPNGQVFTYDNVFTEGIHTKDVYARVVAPIVDLSFKGFNGTVLCYGQTSSGKTHTLYGCADDKGTIPLFADHLFDRIKADEGMRQYIIKVGLLEIYNEKLTDLLNSENPIDIQERDGRVIPHGLEELTVIDRNHLRKVADRIQRERRIGETRMNKESSRSHTILRVNIESFDLTSTMDTSDTSADPPQNLSMTSAVLHFVDLAGSEKQSQTGAEGERLREAIQINKSLSNLSRVIQQLSENAAVVETTESQLTNALCTNKKTAPKSRFVNFRDSKLTRLLQSTLNGEAYISMICNVTPASLDETKSTLNFAKLAKKIQIAPKQNVCSNKTEYEKKLKELQEIIEGKDKEMMALKRQVQNLELSLKVPTTLKTQMPVYSANDRRHSLCPALLQRSSDSKSRVPEFVFPKSRYSSSDEVFLSTEETMLHFRQLETIKESVFSDDLRSDKGVQTDSGLELPSTPKKQMLINSEDARTPAPILRLVNSLLLEDLAQVRTEFEDEKGFLASQLLLLQEDASKAQELQKEKDTLKQENDTLQQEKKELENDVIQQMQKSLSQQKRQKEEANEQMTALSAQKLAEINSLQASLQIAEERIKSYEEKLEAVEEQPADSEVNQNNLDTSELQSQSKIMEEKIKSQMSDIERLQNRITELENEGFQMKESEQKWMEVKRLENRIQDEINESERKQSSIMELESHVTQLETKLEEQSETIAELQSKKENLEEKIIDLEVLQNKVTELEQEAVQMKESEQKLKETLSELRSNKENLEQKMIDFEVLQNKITELEQEAVQMKESEQKLKETMSELRSNKENLEQKAQSQLVDLERLQSTVIQMETHLAEIKEKEENNKAVVKQNPAAIMINREEQCDLIDEWKLRDQNKIMEEKIKSQTIDFERLQNNVTELEQEAVQMKESEQKWMNTISELQSKKENLDKKMIDFELLQNRVTELEQEAVQMKESEQKLKETLSELRSNKENLEQKMIDLELLQNKVTELEQEAVQMKESEQKLKETMSELRSNKENLEQKAQSQLVDLERLQSTVIQMETHLAEIKEKEENNKAVVKQNPAAIMINREEQCDLIDEWKLRDQNKIMEEKIKSQTIDFELLQNRVTELEQEAVQMKESEQKWKETMSELRSNKENLEQKMIDLELLQNKVTELEQEAVQMKESEQKWKETMSELRSNKENLEQKMVDLELLQNKVTELEQEAVQMKESEQKWKETMSELRSNKENLEQKMIDFEVLQNKVTELEQEAVQMKESEQKWMNTISELQSKKENLEEKMIDLELLQNKVTELEQEAVQMKESEQKLKETLSELRSSKENLEQKMIDLELLQNKVTELEQEAVQMKESEQKCINTISELRSKKNNLEQKVESQLVDLERLQRMVIQIETHVAEMKEKEENDKAAVKENPAAIIMTNRGEQCDLVDEWKLRDRNKMLKVKSDTLEYKLCVFKKKMDDKDAKIKELQDLMTLESKGKNLQVLESVPILKEPNRKETSVEPAAPVDKVQEQPNRNVPFRETLPTRLKENQIHVPGHSLEVTSRVESVKPSKLDTAVNRNEIPIPSDELHEAETDLEDSPKKAVDDTIAWFERLSKSTNKENKAPVTSQDDEQSTPATQSVQMKQEKLDTFNRKEALAPPNELQETKPVYSKEVEDDIAFFNQLLASSKAKK